MALGSNLCPLVHMTLTHIGKILQGSKTLMQNYNPRRHGMATESHIINEFHLYNAALQDCRASCKSQR